MSHLGNLRSTGYDGILDEVVNYSNNKQKQNLSENVFWLGRGITRLLDSE
jgi:hypothetical protein